MFTALMIAALKYAETRLERDYPLPDGFPILILLLFFLAFMAAPVEDALFIRFLLIA